MPFIKKGEHAMKKKRGFNFAIVLWVGVAMALGACVNSADEGVDAALLGVLSNVDQSQSELGFGASAAISCKSSAPYGYCSKVRLERVRYCTKTFLGVCTKFATASEYSKWNSYNVDGGKQRETYIARMNQPSRSSTKYLVFLAAGQNPPGNGVDNVVTGQKAGFKKNCEMKTSACTRYIDTRSLAYRVMQGNNFPTSQTFMAAAWDTRFNQTVSSSEKTKILNAFTDWLLNKAYKSNVKGIYLAGSSRGGCLAMRMAKKMINEKGYNNIPIVVHSFDGVCKKSQNELGTYSSQIDNPVSSKSDRKSWKTDMNAQYNYKSKLRIRHLSTGDEVVWIVTGVHSFTDKYATGSYYSKYYGSNKWYEQQWIDMSHTDLGRTYGNSANTITPFINHLNSAWSYFGL